MEVIIFGVGNGVQTKSVCRNMVVEMVAHYGSFVKGDESMPGFGSESEVQDVGKWKQRENLDL